MTMEHNQDEILIKDKYMMALDQGTTSSRVIIFDSNGNIDSVRQRELKVEKPRPGWAEVDASQIATDCIELINGTVADFLTKDPKRSRRQIVSLGITNQRETTVVWNKATGEPLHPALVWFDNRTTELIQKLEVEFGSDFFRERTGLPVSEYFSLGKLLFLLGHPRVREEVLRDNVCFGTIDSWLIHKLSSKNRTKNHLIEATNASRTLMMDLRTLSWSDEILSYLPMIPKSILPTIVHSIDDRYPVVDCGCAVDGLRISGVLGDQQAALFGHLCFGRGQSKTTFGTGAFVLANCGPLPVASTHGLLSTLAFSLGSERQRAYALEGSVASCGAAANWMCEEMRIAEDTKALCLRAASAVERRSSSPDAAQDCIVFVPAFQGLYAPHWDSTARATLVGMSLNTKGDEICMALLEGIASQVRDVIDAMATDMKHEVEEMRVDGGLSRSTELMQLVSDVSGSICVRPEMTEVTALGAALIGGIGSGVFSGLEELKQHFAETKVEEFHSVMCDKWRVERQKKWLDAVELTKGWLKPASK